MVTEGSARPSREADERRARSESRRAIRLYGERKAVGSRLSGNVLDATRIRDAELEHGAEPTDVDRAGRKRAFALRGGRGHQPQNGIRIDEVVDVASRVPTQSETRRARKIVEYDDGGVRGWRQRHDTCDESEN